MKAMRSIILLSALLLGGCAIGNTYDYRSQTPDVGAKSDDSIVVVVLDQRADILTGDKDPDFVGVQRAGFGNPWDVTTTSEAPLADDVAAAVVAALTEKQIEARSVSVPPSENALTAFDAVAASGADKGLILFLHEWKTDTYVNVALIYDVQADVTDAAGTTIASHMIVSTEDNSLGGSFGNPPAYATEHVPIAFRETIERLLNDPEILAALE